MYPVSSAFLNAVKANNRKYYWTGKITTTAGTVYNFDQEDMVKGSGYITSQCCGSTEIELGTVYAAEMGISLFSEINRYTLEDAKVELFYAAGEIHIAPDSCSRKYVRFTTDAMSKILPDAPEAASGWGTRNHYFYEIINNAGKSIHMQLALSAKNIPDDLKEICEKINEHFPAKQQKVNWQWRCPFITSHVTISEDMSDEDIIQILNDQYAQLQEFEKRLVDALGGRKR